MTEIVQVLPLENFDLILYFVDGRIKKYNISHLVGKGVFSVLADPEFYRSRCTIMNHTVAWDISGQYDPSTCIDLDPEVLYRDGVDVKDPLEESA
ncbi:MAG: hypothetical protein A2Z99_02945 [Treponema sp. GWB1_62_6]|nr:MAG: hypothetical protein A2Y36_05535 [Treponema sp. GWA1_62_8]OHE69662.1 MAG: hypothetical protein A2001_08890 [Treponema sp. GWC1_61_84]OHE70781.1 MAG: hypothetical protein A2413_10875 [Treponema sp. RIFOXYC1_FULL_61_9]OHE71344.1 MAG: hypothetical protein A2Z99_02945 [Treponema sp. GWB1_62_6]HCM24997.1 DUF2442 domain-containing protein [Treponema sp.]